MDLEFADIACMWGFNPDNDMAIQRINRDLAIEETIFERLDAFINSLRKNKPPTMSDVKPEVASKRKFRWVSSSGRPDGCRSEGGTHFAGPVREKIILIEGPLKAEVVYNLTGHSVLAVPGVNALLQLEKTLTLLRESGVKRITTAFDMDFLRNFHVQKGYSDLVELLQKLGFIYSTMLWDPDYNGLDDYVWESFLNRGSPRG